MRSRVLPTIRTFWDVPTLLGLIYVTAVLLVGVSSAIDHIVIGGGTALVVRTLREVSRNGRSYRPRRVLWERTLAGIGAVGLGGWVLVHQAGAAAWLGVGTVVVGVWLWLDVLAVYRRRLGPDSELNSGRVHHSTLLEIESVLEDARRPLDAATIADRCESDESAVRRGLTVLLARGRVESGRDGYTRRHLDVGLSFSGRDLLERLLRPFTAVSL